jgi:hypothetical protein
MESEARRVELAAPNKFVLRLLGVYKVAPDDLELLLGAGAGLRWMEFFSL